MDARVDESEAHLRHLHHTHTRSTTSPSAWVRSFVYTRRVGHSLKEVWDCLDQYFFCFPEHTHTHVHDKAIMILSYRAFEMTRAR